MEVWPWQRTGLDRGTRDLDLFVSPDPDNVERLRNALNSVFEDPEINSITAQDLGGPYPVIQYGPPNMDYTIELVSRLGDAWSFENLELERVDAGGVTITVVTPSVLYAMKRDTVRLREWDDAARLAQAFGFGAGGEERE